MPPSGSRTRASPSDERLRRRVPGPLPPYHGDWFGASFLGSGCRGSSGRVRAGLHHGCARSALERGERAKTGRYLPAGAAAFAGAIRNPRVAVAAAGALLGRRGVDVLSRMRAARHSRNDTLAYEPDTRKASSTNLEASGEDVGETNLPSVELSRDELKEKTFKSLRWATTGRVVAEVSSVISAVILAHLVPPTEFGRVAIAANRRELALALANEGVGSALVRRSVLERAHVESAALMSLVIGVTLMLVTLFILPYATTPLFGSEVTGLFRLFSPMFVIAAVGIVPLAMLERDLDFKRISMIEIATVCPARWPRSCSRCSASKPRPTCWGRCSGCSPGRCCW